MNALVTNLGLLTALMLSGTAALAQAPTIDGTRDASYPAALALQTVNTQFGDATSATAMQAGGSELDNIHARIEGSNLYLFLGGNLETNYNKLDIFFDSKSGGQNKLADNTQYVAAMNGLQFDADFTADYALSLAVGTGDLKLYADYTPIPTGGSTATSIGSNNTNLTQNLTFSSVVAGAGTGAVAVDDSNVAGVTGSTTAADPAAAAAVTTGIEYMIPLTALGTTAGGGDIKIIAFINGSNHDYLSNQVLAGVPAGTSNFATTNVDFTTVTGNQYVTVNNSTVTATAADRAAVAHPAYPNPFTASTTLTYEASQPGTYTLRIRSLSGQVVATQLVVAARAGTSTVSWNGCNAQGQPLAAGVYLAELNGQYQRLTMLR